MRKVFLVTGFNNWGKTHIIADLFGKRAFRRDRLHRFQGSGCDFMVMPYSNDDLGLYGYCEEYYERIAELPVGPKHVVSAFCPTKELERRKPRGPKDKTSVDIITELYGDDEVHMLLLQHKWCDHAELHPVEIARFYASLSNVTITTIPATTYAPRLATLSASINAQLP